MSKKNNNDDQVDKYHVEMAGEYAVLSKLMQMNYMATLTLGNAKKVDILITSDGTDKLVKLEVKTTKSLKTCEKNNSKIFRHVYSWRMDKKHEEMSKNNLIYCFVILGDLNKQSTEHTGHRFFLLTEKDVTEFIKKQFKYWKNYQEEEVKGKKIPADYPARTFMLACDSNSVSHEHGVELYTNYENWDPINKRLNC